MSLAARLAFLCIFACLLAILSLVVHVFACLNDYCVIFAAATEFLSLYCMVKLSDA